MKWTDSKIEIIKIPCKENDKRMNFVKQIVFIGTGASSSVPDLTCMMQNCGSEARCEVCLDASSYYLSKNRRNNTSIMLRYKSNLSISNSPLKNILFDCGKTFYHSAFTTLIPSLQKQDSKYPEDYSLTAVIISHAHADAFFGLDDLRHWTFKSKIQPYVDIYTDPVSFTSIQSVFPYLIDKNLATGGGTVSQTRFHLFEPALESNLSFPTSVEGKDFCITPIPEKQNSPFMSLGFYFDSIAYISDLSGLPQESVDFLENKKVSLLIIDSLYPFGNYPSHLCFDQVLDLVKKFQPKEVYLIGLAHLWDYNKAENYFNAHPRINEDEVLKNVSFRLAFDGLILDFE